MLLKPYRDLLIRYFAPHRLQVVALAALLLAGTGLQLVTPQVTRHFIDTAQAGGALRTLTVAAGLFMLVALLGQVVTVVETYAAENLGWVATNALRTDLAQHCLDLDMSFHNAHTPGELIERIDGDVGTLANFFSRFVLQLLGSGVLLLGVLALVWREEWRIGLALTVVSSAALVVLNIVRAAGTRYSRAAREASAGLFGFLEERLSGLADIQASGAQTHVLYRMYPHLRVLFQSSRTSFLMGGVLGSAGSAVFTLGWILVFAMGAYFYRAGTMSIGTVYLLFQYTAMLRQPLGQLSQQAQDFQRASASVARIVELYATASRLHDGPGLAIPTGPLSVEFDHVTFGYSATDTSSLPVLMDISFSVPPGRVLGILGRTGSGKTTLMRLLLRLYDPNGGTIRLGDVDLRQARLAELHQHIGVVTQEVQLFQATVRDNLTLFARGIPDARVVKVIDELGLTTWFRTLPNGLETELAPGSGGLSAGEAQLLAFARVFLRDPDVVILDEASSRLDPATERLIERAVDRLFANRTGIVIAHRLATVQHVDDILILSDGRTAEYGPRQQLAQDPASLFHGLLVAGDQPLSASLAGQRS
jgi:ABC-type multidrug transport system fused ATPase/permease subunit